MARISGVDLPKNKRGEIGLTYIYGIGRTTATKILTSNGIDVNMKVKDWNDENINGILTYIANNLKLEGELRGEVQQNIKRLQDIGATVVFVTVRVCRCVVSVLSLTHVLVRVSVRQWLTRKW